MAIKKYKKGDAVSYSLGIAPTLELLNRRVNSILRIVTHPDFEKSRFVATVYAAADKNNIPIEVCQKTLHRLSAKDNCYLAAMFSCYENAMDDVAPHILLTRPSNHGNLGTICRAMLALNYHNLAIIRPSVDFFDPQTIRASMGAVFALKFNSFSSIDHYRNRYPLRKLLILTGDGANPIDQYKAEGCFTLALGNEGSGFTDEEKQKGTTVAIRQNPSVDSLNLATAAAISLYHFSDFRSHIKK